MKILRVVFIVSIMLLCRQSVFSAEFEANQPFLLTSSGQSADVLMVKVLAQKNNLQFTYDKIATLDTLSGMATLIIVSGGSTKGLGAAKIDKDEEIARVQTLIHAARKANIKIITMHLGGKARRGKLSDEFNKPAAENADCLIVVKAGDDDQFFSSIAREKNIPIFLIDKIMDAGNVLMEIFKAE
ncbi:hypothetical protein JW960_16020 [candidate division KSB1 bacterium]|nr:hypothetical protein [candidate division KSB1 bacterium]